MSCSKEEKMFIRKGKWSENSTRTVASHFLGRISWLHSVGFQITGDNNKGITME